MSEGQALGWGARGVSAGGGSGRAADGEIGALEKGGKALRLRATVYLCGCGAARGAHTKHTPHRD